MLWSLMEECLSDLERKYTLSLVKGEDRIYKVNRELLSYSQRVLSKVHVFITLLRLHSGFS